MQTANHIQPLPNIGVAVLFLDTDGYIQQANAAALALTGYQPEDLLHKPVKILYPNTDSVKSNDELETARKNGSFATQGWRVQQNGARLWAETIFTAEYTHGGQLEGYNCVILDRTSGKEHELELRQSEERYRLMVAGVKDYAIFLMDAGGYIQTWNEGAQRIKGYAPNEIIGKHFSTFYTAGDLLDDKPQRELKIARETGKYEEEGWRLKKDGSRFWASIVITPVYNAHQELIGFSKVTRDLTERKEAERKLRESYENYRHIARELEITNRELYLTNQELENFASVASHDLQEPLRAIRSFLQLMDMKLQAGQTDELKTYVDKSATAANRMQELIRNLLYYTQVGRGEAVMETLQVDELINNTLQNLKSAIETSHAEIVVDNEVKTVKGDRVQLTQLFQNLISNALKFTNDRNPVVKIEGRKAEETALFSVADNGIGIAKENQNKVFEIFKRLHAKTKYPGTGIGLSICKKIVEQHQGNIWLQSAVGQGTTFYFVLNEKKKGKTER